MTQKAGEDEQWRDGRVRLHVFKATDEAYEITRDAYFKLFAENALGGKRAFHSIGRMELAEWNAKSSGWHLASSRRLRGAVAA